MATIDTGSNPIENGLVVYAQHVRPIYDALVGTANTDIIVGGNLTLNGGSVYKLNLGDAALTASLARFTNTVSASGDIFVTSKLTALTGSFTNVSSTYVTASLISASTNVTTPVGVFSNNVQFTNLGTIVTGSGSVPLVQHIVTQSGAVGHGLIFGGSQFRDYIFQGTNSPRIGIGSSTVVSTASLASGSFVLNLPAFTPAPSTLLISSSDAYVMKVATLVRSQSFAISSSGFVGINTWTPREALDIQLGNAAIKNPTTTSGSILYVENNSGRILDVTNQITNSIFTVQTTAGLPILDTGTNSAGSSYVAVSGNGSGITSAISSSFTLVSASMALSYRNGGATTLTSTDLVYVDTTGGVTVTLPLAATAGRGRVYHILNRGGGSATTVARAGSDTIDDLTFISIPSYGTKTVISDGVSSWWVLSVGLNSLV